MMPATERGVPPLWVWPALVVLVPFAMVGIVLWLAAGTLLMLIVWASWCRRGRYALVVYSNSPIWQDYFERRILPEIGARGVVLNWSDRKQWPYSLPVVLFRMFGGTREFNPLAIVFEPFRWPRRFRFFKAFQDFKHGDSADVEKIRREFFELMDRLERNSDE